jgi:hypothetical protein
MRKRRLAAGLSIIVLVIMSILIIYQEAFAAPRSCMMEGINCSFWQAPNATCSFTLYECTGGWCWLGCVCTNNEAYSTSCWY